MSKYQRIFLRFVRGFIAGGLSTASALVATGTTVTNLEDLKKFSIALAVAFATGGLLSIDKLVREYFAQIEESE